MKHDVMLRRLAFAGAILLLVLYGINVALRLDHIKFGAATWSVGDVGEFRLVLLAMVCFVAGLLLLEARSPKPDVDAAESTTGGNQ